MPKFSDSDGLTWGFTPGERARTRAGVERLKQIRSERAAMDAEEAALLAGLAGIAVDQIGRMPSNSDCAFPLRSMATELGLALKEPPRAMQGRMERASELVAKFPATHAALAGGRITDRHARAVADAGADISEPGARAAYETAVLALAEKTTPYRIKELAKQVADTHQPTAIIDRHEKARADRGAFVEDLPDGMAMLGLIGPAVRIHAAYDRLTGCGRAVRRDRRALIRELDGAEPGPEDPAHVKYLDDRHLAQLRSDIALDLLLTGTPTGHDLDQHITATVEITIPVETLAGLDDGPALLAGYGPIDPDTARRLAGHAPGWERLFLNPDTGALLTVDHYAPSAAQRRFLHARDRSCRVPGCTTRAKHCDIDHTIPYSTGGITNVENLNCVCEGHHMMKHHAPWGFTNLGHGRIRISSPCGFDYTEGPPLLFPALGPPAPF
ncbi:HNH endonuclease signature motif containing protein [Microbacterium rhizophilus]|uniref:HNH endonuclease signature motif containing protein n=1 Tax=Microbacterium rhizophilus TaxID=3138934 RepID=UPI0031EFE7F6